jgi:protein ImuB
LALDVTGLGPLFGGEAALAERVMREFHQRGLSVRVAIADTLGAAWAVAHFEDTAAQPRSSPSPLTGEGLPAVSLSNGGEGEDPIDGCISIIPSGATFSALAPLPVAALRLPEETLALLAAVGIRTIEQLTSLPRASLTARFGPQLLEQLDRATGEASELLVPHQPAPEFAAEWTFESPTEHVETIEQVLEELMRRVCVSLAARGEGALGFVCRIDSADRERIGLPVGLFRPSASAKHLKELLRLRLEKIRLESPVAALAIEVTAVAPLSQQQQELFIQDRCREAPRHLAALVERLSSRLGREAVVRPVLLPDAQPEYASVDLPWTGGQARGKGQGTRGKVRGSKAKSRTLAGSLVFDPKAQTRRASRRAPATSFHRFASEPANASRHRLQADSRSPIPDSRFPLRPIWLADPPVAIVVISVVPDGPPAQFHYAEVDYRIARAWGPERIETGWWRKLGAGTGAVMARSPDRAMNPTAGLPVQAGDLRSAKWHGQETVPQRGAGVRRDYYRVETTSGHRFWLFRRLTDGRWFLHGVFG